jgi:hypothetical protein
MRATHVKSTVHEFKDATAPDKLIILYILKGSDDGV